MADALSHLAYLGPGGPEFMVIMLVLLVLFGSKDAPRILRKINEIISQIRNTADGFKREVLYSDIETDPSSYAQPTDEDGVEHEDGAYIYNEDQDSSDEVFEALEEDLSSEGLIESTENEVFPDEDGDAR